MSRSVEPVETTPAAPDLDKLDHQEVARREHPETPDLDKLDHQEVA